MTGQAVRYLLVGVSNTAITLLAYALLVAAGVPAVAASAVAFAAGWQEDQASEFLDNYLRVTRRAKAVVLKVFGA